MTTSTDVREFFQSITFGDPRWVERMIRYCTEPGPEQVRFLKLAERYWFAMPQSIREAVLAAKSARTLEPDSRVGPNTTANP